MNPRHALTLLLSLCLASSAHAESFAGSIAFGTSTDLQGELWFTALDPGDMSSSLSVLAGYSQAPSSDYTYLYVLQNDSVAGASTPFCNEHCFYGLDLETLFDPNGGGIHTISFDAGNGGEAPSFFGTNTAPDLVFFEFDDPPNHGVVPEGGFSAVLRFYSPFGPSSLGGAFVTNNTGDVGSDFFHITSGVTTPVPEPASAALLALGLAALAARRRRVA